MRIIITNPGPTVQSNMGRLQERMAKAIETAANMIASMIEEAGRANIAAAGRFGSRWTEGFHALVEPLGTLGRMITSFHDIPYADIFETGGTIQGKPLLWLGISGTDAEGVAPKDYSGQLFSIKHPNGHPLLMSRGDKKPKYFGIESVTIPKKFDLNNTIDSVLQDFQSVFDTAWKESE